MAQLLSLVRSALAGIMNRRQGGNVVIGTGDGRIVINRQEERVYEEMRVIPGLTTLRHSPFSDNFTLETWEMKQAYRKWAAEPSVKAALTGKVQNVAALGLQVTPADKKNPREHDKADFVRHCLQNSAYGFAGIIWEILIHGCMDGWSLCEPVLHEETRGKFRGKWTLKDFKAKDTRYVIPLVDAYRNVVGLFNHRSGYHEPFDPAKFVLYSHLPLFHNPTGQSDLRSVYRAMQMIPAVLKLRMIFLDKYTGPFLTARTRDVTLKTRMAQELAKARADGFIVLDRDSEVAALDLATKGTADFQAGLDDLRKEVATGISGAFLHMMTAADPNARGDSQVQKDTVELGVWWLAEQAAIIINKQVVPRLIDPNFGSTEELPTVSLEAVRPEDIKADLGIDETLDRLGVDLSLEEVRERARRSPPRDDTDSLQKAKAASQPQQNPLGAGNPFGGGGALPFAEQLAEAGLTLIPLTLLDTLSGERVTDKLPDDDWEIQAYDRFAEGSGFTGTKKDRLGRTLCYRNGIRVPCKPVGRSLADRTPHDTDEFAKRADRSPTARQHAREHFGYYRENLHKLTPEVMSTMPTVLARLTVPELRALQQSLGPRSVLGGKSKAEQIAKLKSYLVWKVPGPRDSTRPTPPAPVDPTAAIQPKPQPNRQPPTIQYGWADHPYDQNKAKEGMAQVFGGRDVTDDQIAAMACAPPGAKVTVTSPDPNRVDLAIFHEGVTATRTIKRMGDKIVAHNNLFKIHPDSPHRGNGYRLFADQVAAYKAAGVSRIETLGAGSGWMDGPEPTKEEMQQSSDYNGYYTWPRLGYEGKMDSRQFARLPAEVKQKLGNNRSIRYLFDNIPGGNKVWKQWGSDTDYVFDLSDGSASLKALADYVTKREQGGRRG